MAGRKLTRKDLAEAAEKYKNWGRWGPEDEIGTLNHTSPAGHRRRRPAGAQGQGHFAGAQFRPAPGPQGAKSKYPALGRVNPVHTMLRTGTDAYSGVLDHRGIRAADDMVVMPLQCGTQWDGLGHVFYENFMWNGYDCREVTSAGAQKCGIEKTKARWSAAACCSTCRARSAGTSLEDGYGITCADLDRTAEQAGRGR